MKMTARERKSFGHRLYLRRLAMGLAQTDVTRLCGVSRSNLSRFETGKANPSTETVARLAETLNTTAEWLIEGNR